MRRSFLLVSSTSGCFFVPPIRLVFLFSIRLVFILTLCRSLPSSCSAASSLLALMVAVLGGGKKARTQPTLVQILALSAEAVEAQRRATQATRARDSLPSSRPFTPVPDSARAALRRNLSPKAEELGTSAVPLDVDWTCPPVAKVVELAVSEGVCDTHFRKKLMELVRSPQPRPPAPRHARARKNTHAPPRAFRLVSRPRYSS